MSASPRDAHFYEQSKHAMNKEKVRITLIWLTELIPELLNMVDEKKIALNPAYELSFLKKEEQTQLLDAMDSEQATPSLSQIGRASCRERV